MQNAAWTKNNGATAATSGGENLLTDGTSSNSAISQTVGVLQTSQTYTVSYQGRAGTNTQSVIRLARTDSPFTGVAVQTTTVGASYINISLSFSNSQTFNQSVVNRVGTEAGFNEGNLYHRNLQFNIGTNTTYEERTDATATKVLNLGTTGSTGDFSYTNGSNLDMLTVQNNRYCLRFTSSSSNGLTSGLITGYDAYTYIIAIRPTTLGGAMLLKANNKDRFVINADGSFRFNADTGQVVTSIGRLVANTWYILAFTVTGTGGSATVNLYRNGAKETVSNTLTNRTVDNTTPWTLSTGAFLSGQVGEAHMYSGAATDIQIQNAFATLRSKYGL